MRRGGRAHPRRVREHRAPLVSQKRLRRCGFVRTQEGRIFKQLVYHLRSFDKTWHKKDEFLEALFGKVCCLLLRFQVHALSAHPSCMVRRFRSPSIPVPHRGAIHPTTPRPIQRQCTRPSTKCTGQPMVLTCCFNKVTKRYESTHQYDLLYVKRWKNPVMLILFRWKKPLMLILFCC